VGVADLEQRLDVGLVRVRVQRVAQEHHQPDLARRHARADLQVAAQRT
jgi:hypothetical protein